VFWRCLKTPNAYVEIVRWNGKVRDWTSLKKLSGAQYGVKDGDLVEATIVGNVIKGYWKLPNETRDAFTPDGYFMSGDIGMFDDDGNLLITDRKKDLIITSGGKNVAPQKIENMFKSDTLFTQFIVIGERKKYLTGLCNINPEEAARLATEENITFNNPAELLENQKFLDIVQKHIDERNAHLAKYESIKNIRIVKSDFSQEGGELTPSLKLKRKVVLQKYNDLIDDMYGKEAVDELYAKK